ncbi:Myeloid-derived growth factor [Trichoplax sp. H2]|nr:Myeloid-derived growth factor [Trichoplax sp. H2]|eukprot:RDD40305.1 Myeloid-derived growth factor [Trichoplax sp. H2]
MAAMKYLPLLVLLFLHLPIHCLSQSHEMKSFDAKPNGQSTTVVTKLPSNIEHQCANRLYSLGFTASLDAVQNTSTCHYSTNTQSRLSQKMMSGIMKRCSYIICKKLQNPSITIPINNACSDDTINEPRLAAYHANKPASETSCGPLDNSMCFFNSSASMLQNNQPQESIQCQFTFAVVGGTNENWVMKVSREKDGKYTCIVTRPDKDSYLVFMSFQLKDKDAKLESNTYAVTDSVVQHAQGKFKANLKLITVSISKHDEL